MEASVLVIVFAVIFFFSGFRVINQYEQALVFTLGRFTGMKQPGLRFVIVFFQKLVRVDMRIRTLDVMKQQIMTKDNVPVHVNAAIFYKVSSPEQAIIQVQDYAYAISQYGQTALRDVIGGMNLDTLLTERTEIGNAIRKIVDKETHGWGLDVQAIKIQDIELPDDLKRIMSRQAAAEREKRANIIKSEGDKEAAKNLADAARMMEKAKGAMQLRTLQTLDGLGPTASNTVVLALPVDVLEWFKKGR
ncbi:MAG: slipin family protein [Spirochaetes bacterium]|nr:slipin family protein [Spirochaetota bacterium]MBX3720416.1 slipin family protein [Turneriella sp.]